MRAALCEEIGGPLHLRDVDEPKLNGPDEVLVRVAAAAINFPDLLMIAGKYQGKPPLPFIPGLEAAGTVLACGEAVTDLAPGDRVISLVDHGAYAEQVVAQGNRVFKIDPQMPFDVAAGFGIAYMSAWYGLVERCRLKAGEDLVVLGAAGGIGLAAVDIGAATGARVIAAARGRERLSLCTERGASAVIDTADAELAKEVKALTDGKGADVIFDPVGGPMAEQSLHCIARHGRIAVVGFAAGDIQKIPANYLLLKDCDVVGVNGAAFIRSERTRALAGFSQLNVWYLDGRLQPHISQTAPLADVDGALALLSARKAAGKVVLRVR